MELYIAAIFWFAVLLLIHAYLIYPLSLRIFKLFKKRPLAKDQDSLPSISILIAAHNEEKVIADRIDNIKSLNFDFSRLELIIGSDCSSDQTNEILNVKNKNYNWLKVVTFNQRRGKAAVLNDLVGIAKNDILVFSDANTQFNEDALIKLISEFADPKVGGVCGRLVLEEPVDDFDKTNRERLYWQYETQLKILEGNLGTLIAANGGIYAIRKNLFTEFPVQVAITDDLFQTLAVLRQGYKFIYDFDAIAVEEVSKEILTEFRRKVRFATTNFQTLKFFRGLLIPKNLLLSYTFLSHKVIRWFVPLLLILLIITNALLFNYQSFYRIIFYFQAGFYLSALLGYILNKLKINISLFSIIYYYVFTNLALFIGLYKFLMRKQVYIWNSTPR
ncbi:MAG: glycosyltransferase family 2 protein [Ignavibacteriaceae bacterium]|nr:glycosyltransferase family 2 protein [Ignavibacteriaceae bacterium]